MKLLGGLTKFMVAGIIFMVVAVVFMFTTMSYLPRLSGANYYDHGCFDGVTHMRMEFLYNKVDRPEYTKFEEEARKHCNNAVEKLKKDGYLF